MGCRQVSNILVAAVVKSVKLTINFDAPTGVLACTLENTGDTHLVVRELCPSNDVHALSASGEEAIVTLSSSLGSFVNAVRIEPGQTTHCQICLFEYFLFTSGGEHVVSADYRRKGLCDRGRSAVHVEGVEADRIDDIVAFSNSIRIDVPPTKVWVPVRRFSDGRRFDDSAVRLQQPRWWQVWRFFQS